MLQLDRGDPLFIRDGGPGLQQIPLYTREGNEAFALRPGDVQLQQGRTVEAKKGPEVAGEPQKGQPPFTRRALECLHLAEIVSVRCRFDLPCLGEGIKGGPGALPGRYVFERPGNRQ